MAVVEVSVVPIGTGTSSLSKYVAEAVKAVREEKGIKYELTAMGTIMEGELGQILAMVEKMHEAVFKAGVGRVLTTVRIDDRRDKKSGMAHKVAAVKKKLG